MTDAQKAWAAIELAADFEECDPMRLPSEVIHDVLSHYRAELVEEWYGMLCVFPDTSTIQMVTDANHES